MDIKVTTPKDMTTDNLPVAVEMFEEIFAKKDKDHGYYHLIIVGELSRINCEAVEKIYKEAGWSEVKCRTSSENGEKPGLTSLILYV